MSLILEKYSKLSNSIANKQLSQSASSDVINFKEILSQNNNTQRVEKNNFSVSHNEQENNATDFVEKMREKLIRKIKYSDAFESKDIRNKYIKLAKEMKLEIIDSTHDFTAKNSTKTIYIDSEATVFKTPTMTRYYNDREMPKFIFEKNFVQSLAHEMRHLTPANHAIKITIGTSVASLLSSDSHDKNPREKDANSFAKELYLGKKGIKDY